MKNNNCKYENQSNDKSIILSIRPKWCELIEVGDKTIEIRKTKPRLSPPFKCYIYCTQGGISDLRTINHSTYQKRMKVIGEFVCDEIHTYDTELWNEEVHEDIRELIGCEDDDEYITIATNADEDWENNKVCKASCVSIDGIRKYVGTGINTFYGWHISNLKIYDEPKELSEFGLSSPPQSWCYVK